MPPSNSMAETLIRIDDSTRKKLAAKQSNGTRRNSDKNKSAVDAALGKFTDDFEDDIAKRSCLGRKDKNDLAWSEHSSNSSRPKRTTSVSRNASKTVDHLAGSEHNSNRKTGGKCTDDICVSEHTTSTNARGRMISNRSHSRTRTTSDNDSGFQDLKGDDEGSTRSTRTNAKGNRGVRSGRKKTDQERVASPAPVQKRPSSLGPLKKRTSSPGPMKKRSTSPGALIKTQSSTGQPSTTSGPVKQRSSSLGPMKHKPKKSESFPSQKLTESAASLKKPTDSSGPQKRRSGSAGPLSRRGAPMRPERVSQPGDNNGELESMLGQVSGYQPRRKGARSVASAPIQENIRRPELRHSNAKVQKHKSVRVPETSASRGPPAKSKSADGADILDVADQMSARYAWQGYRPSEQQTNSGSSDNTHTTHPVESSEETKVADPGQASPRKVSPQSKPKRSMSALPGATLIKRASSPIKKDTSADMENEMAKHKVKRNNSVAHTPSHAQTDSPQPGPENGGMTRAHSMLLHREMTRRGKSNSLMDLVQYKEEEIHSTSYFASNHVLVNRERMKRGLRPLTRNIAMDEMARKIARAMAESNGLNNLCTTYVGNVLRGESIRSIHRSTMQQKQGRERANLLNPYFQEFGVGTCKGADGMLYMCQLFSERLVLALTDTTD
jgi:uncharacterized protein YkwD